MASTLLRRQLCTRSPRIFTRGFSASSSLLQASSAQQGAQTTGAKNVFDKHTVEDLQGIHATEILAETGLRSENQLRHFTGELLCAYSAFEYLLTGLV
jgi:NADH dehydrogenase (ubiquinone) Fe-S protein 2